MEQAAGSLAAALSLAKAIGLPDERMRSMMTQTTTDGSSLFTSSEWEALALLRERYHQGRDLFSEREMARLRFVRWLYRTARLTSWEDNTGYTAIVTYLYSMARSGRTAPCLRSPLSPAAR
jgi:hypothetical protein